MIMSLLAVILTSLSPSSFSARVGQVEHVAKRPVADGQFQVRIIDRNRLLDQVQTGLCQARAFGFRQCHSGLLRHMASIVDTPRKARIHARYNS